MRRPAQGTHHPAFPALFFTALTRACLVALYAAWPDAAEAGPPYVTDDPEPTRTGGWENYLYASGTAISGATVGQAGIELNYGAAGNTQLTLALPEAYAATSGLRAAPADPMLAAKYRFLHPAPESWLPDAAIFPAVTLPIGARAFSTGHATFFLPLWLEKDWGKWSVFGGGGYTLNPGAGQRDFALTGLAVTRAISDSVALGVEITHQTPAIDNAPAATNLGFGATYQFSSHWALMGSGGPGLEHPSRAGAASFYVSLQFTD